MPDQWDEIQEDTMRLARLIDPWAFEPITQTHNFAAASREKKERRDAAVGSIVAVFRKFELAIINRMAFCATNSKPN